MERDRSNQLKNDRCYLLGWKQLSLDDQAGVIPSLIKILNEQKALFDDVYFQRTSAYKYTFVYPSVSRVHGKHSLAP